jgi:hypothetical protein
MADAIQANDLDATVLSTMTLRDVLTQAFRNEPHLAMYALEAKDDGVRGTHQPELQYTLHLSLQFDMPLALAKIVARQVMTDKADQWGC